MLNALAAAEFEVSLYLLPMAAVVSLVYSASRYELTSQILIRSARLFAQIVGFMLAVFAVLWFFSFGL